MVQTTQHSYNNVLLPSPCGRSKGCKAILHFIVAVYALLLIASFAVGDQLNRLTEALEAACPCSLLLQISAAA